MSEELPVVEEAEGTPPDPADVEAAALATDDGKGNKMVPLSALMGAKREIRDLNKKVREIEPIAARVTEINEKLEQAQPFINAIVGDPRLKAAALRAVNGTRASADTTEQPDDPDAVATAEDLGLYLADGVTLDVARAQRIINRVDTRSRRQADEAVRPLAGVTLGQQADANIRQALAMTDDDGVPLATPESIQEVAKQLPSHLLSNPDVMEIVVNSAIGIDRRKGRTPKAVDAPVYLERNSGRRAPGPVVTAEQRAMLARVGLTEDAFVKSTKRADQAISQGRAIDLE